MRLADALLTHRPRENSGSSSANRFNFQRTWALCHLMQLHESEQHYVLILEYHDDILVVDSEVEPQKAAFFQIKTKKEGHWTQRSLVATSQSERKPGSSGKAGESPEAPRSILGKLLEHCRSFLPCLDSLNVVSNLSFKVPLVNLPASTDRDHFCFTELTEEARAEVKAKLMAELGLTEDPPWEKIFLLVTGISLTSHETHAVGALAEFLNRRRPGGSFAVQPLYVALSSELSRRATNEWHPQTYDELCQRKGLRRSEFEKFLRLAERPFNPEEHFRELKAQLAQESFTYREMSDIEASWHRYDIAKLDPTDTTIQTLEEQLTVVVVNTAESPDWHTLREFLSLAERNFTQLYGPPALPFDFIFLRGAILHELKSYEARKLSSIDSQSAPEKP